MSGTNFVADTNALIYLLGGYECMKPFLNEKLYMSIISEMEMLSFSELSIEDENNIKGLISKCSVIPVDNDIKDKTIQIRRKDRLKLPDAIIAATAIVNDMTLVTADKEFEKVDELKLELLNI